MSDTEETRKCSGICGLIKPIDKFPYRNKKKMGARRAQCYDCIRERENNKTYEYEPTKLCTGICGSILPIADFSFKNEKSRKLESRCRKCIAAARSKKKQKQTHSTWYHQNGGKERKKLYNQAYKLRNSELNITDPEYEKKCSILIYDSFLRNKKVKDHRIQYLGIAPYYYEKWMEYQFDTEMAWDNYGIYWEIEHIIPISSFDLTKEKEIYSYFDWKNTRPIRKSAEKSISNNDTMEDHKTIVCDFICARSYYYDEIVDSHRKSYYTRELYGR